VNNRKLSWDEVREGWTWDKDKSVAIVTVEAKKIRETVKVVVQ